MFSLARSFNTTLSQGRQGQKTDQPSQQPSQGREASPLSMVSPTSLFKGEQVAPQESHYDQEGQGEKQGKNGREGERESSPQDQQQKRESEEKKKKITSIGSIQAARSKEASGSKSSSQARRVQASNAASGAGSQGGNTLGSVESIYIRFMALMARILGQAEYEAHQLYLRIKERTDSIDVLTLLISKINSEKGAIDWSNNEEMKQLIEKVRAMGVEISEGKYTWSEEEKKLLKENIQMRKDSMEKMTQLERTDMQRFLQEASQCHQARSNVLKLLKEVMDNIIANMRP